MKKLSVPVIFLIIIISIIGFSSNDATWTRYFASATLFILLFFISIQLSNIPSIAEQKKILSSVEKNYHYDDYDGRLTSRGMGDQGN